MIREIHTLRGDAAACYSRVLADATDALLTRSYEDAAEVLSPIAREVWMGSLALHGKTAEGVTVRTSRSVSDRIRAQVFLRDGFLCSYCHGRTIPRNILVALSDVFPDALGYHPNYKRGALHPAYWALAPEADHTLAHANGGSSGIENLTTMHAMCNTMKSSLAVETLPEVAAAIQTTNSSWDGLLSCYADIVIAGDSRGRRHAAPDYHLRWLRHYGLSDDRARVLAAVARQ